MIPFTLYIKFITATSKPSFWLLFPKNEKNYSNLSALLGGASSDGKKHLLKFVDEVINQCNKERVTGDNEFLIEMSDVHGKKMFKIFTPLRDDFPESFPPPCYISPEEFKEVLEIWIREEEKFYKNPEQYVQNVLERGATLLRPADFKDSDAVKKKIDAEKFCLIEDWREAK